MFGRAAVVRPLAVTVRRAEPYHPQARAQQPPARAWLPHVRAAQPHTLAVRREEHLAPAIHEALRPLNISSSVFSPAPRVRMQAYYPTATEETPALHSPRYLAQQQAWLEMMDAGPITDITASSVNKTRVVCLLKHPLEQQVLGSVWVYSANVLHSPEAMKIIEQAMRDNQCGLGLFQVQHEINCLRGQLPSADQQSVHAYLIHHAVLKPIKPLRDAPPPAAEVLGEQLKAVLRDAREARIAALKY